MHVGLLGTLRVTHDAVDCHVPGAMPRRLLALLTTSNRQDVTVPALVDGLWGMEPPATAHATVQSHVLRLRKALPDPSLVERTPLGYRVLLHDDDVDARVFERIAAAGSSALASGDTSAAERLLTEALDLWRGPALAEFGDSAVLGAEAARLERLRDDVVERRFEAALLLPSTSPLSAELERLVRRHPIRESLWSLLMRAQYREGRQADALLTYQRARNLLIDELGVEPGPVVQDALRRVLAQDPSLAAPDMRAPNATAPSPDQLGTHRAAVAERRQVSIVVVALNDQQDLDVEEAESRLDTLRGEVARVSADHGGVTLSTLGARCVIVLGIPTTHEDDAARALLAALRLRDLDGIQCAAVTTGTALVSGTQVTGPPLSKAVEGATAAAEGSVVVDATTRRLAQQVTTFGPDAVWTPATGAVPLDPPVRPVSDTRFVGREEELAVLGAVVEAVHTSGRPQVVTIVGDPGMGKSRLALQVCASLPPGMQPVRARCAPYGPLSPLAPLATLVSGLAGSTDVDIVGRRLRASAGADEGARLAAFLAPLLDGGAASSTSREMTFDAWARALILLLDRPTVLVVEDLHWAPDLLIDFFEHFVAVCRHTPVLLLATSRPELFELRRSWPPAGAAGSTIQLDALTEPQCLDLVNVILGKAIDANVRGQIATRSGGVPLFAEELSRLAAEDGADNPEAGVPDVLAGVLQARLDTLPLEQRRALQAAAVAGDPFSTELVAALFDGEAPLATLLGDLAQRGFTRRAQGSAHEWTVSHDLVRDAAYGRLTRSERASKHLAAARWWAAKPTAVPSNLAHAGNHAATAFDLARIVGDVTVAEAARPLACTGLLAAVTSLRSLDVSTAITLAERALTIAEGSDIDTLALRCRYTEVLADHGNYEQARALALEVLPQLEHRNDPLRVDLAMAYLLALFNLGEDWTLAFDPLARAVTALPEGIDRARAMCVLGMGQVMMQTQGAMRAAIRTVDEAERIAGSAGVDLATVHMIRGRARLALGDEGGFDELDHCFDRVTPYDSPFAVVGGRQWIAGASHHWRGPVAELAARTVLAKMATTRGIRSLVSMGAAEEVRVLAELGRIDDAIARADELDVGDDAQLRWSVVQRGLCQLDLDGLDAKAVERIAQIPWSEPDDMRHVLGVVLVRAGFAVRTSNPASARELLLSLGNWQPFLERDGAPELFPRLMRTARAAGAADVVMPVLALPANGTPLREHLRAHLAGMGRCLDGDDTGAVPYLRTAFEGWLTFGAAYEAAYAQTELGDALARVGDQEAQGVQLQAAERFESLGLPTRPWDVTQRNWSEHD